MTHCVVKLAASHGGTFAADGYGYPYVRAVCLASLLWAFVGVALSFAIVRRSYGGSLAAVGAVVFWLASPLFWYTVYEPTMPHAVALGAVALFLTAWLRARDHGGFRAWGTVGLAAGLMLSVQRYDAFYLLLPALTFAGRFHDLLRGGTRFDSKGNFACVLANLFGLAIERQPLWMFQLATEGSLLRAGEPELALSLWKRGSVVEALFSSKHGLFSWTPAAYLAVIGLAGRAVRRDALARHYFDARPGVIFLCH